MIRLAAASTFAFLTFLMAGCASSADLLHISTAEQAAYDAGMRRPENSCAHGYVKKYYFVKTDLGAIRNPYTRWDCIDKDTAEEVTEINREATQSVLQKSE